MLCLNLMIGFGCHMKEFGIWGHQHGCLLRKDGLFASEVLIIVDRVGGHHMALPVYQLCLR